MLLAESGESPLHDRFGRAWITKVRKNRMSLKMVGKYRGHRLEFRLQAG
jgi:hypothetical protein